MNIPRFRAFVLLLALLVAGVAFKLWLDSIPRPANSHENDPRLTYATPYQNVRPEVKYVGDEACAECHRDVCDSYHRHPMGQALAPVALATPIERYEAAQHNPFVAQGLSYAIERQPNRILQREWVEGKSRKTLAEAELAFVVGSGARARSYLIEHDGYLFQAPATWYVRENRWDLSPSYELRNHHFGRPITPGCLFCHCSYADHVPGTLNRYRQPIFRGYSIGCERCHGPGELHVRARRQGEVPGDIDDTIVNPARLEHGSREAICQQCHLQGEQRIVCRGRSDFDFRPGLPLHLFQRDFVSAHNREAEGKFVSSVEQMMSSRCYLQSKEPRKLGCISCHDPHRSPAPDEKTAFYRGRCLQCHTEASCSLAPTARKEKADNCIACHMPRTGSEVVHTAVTDHRVRRREAKLASVPPLQQSFPSPDDLVLFQADRAPLDEQENSRSLGLALMNMLARGMPDPVARTYAEKALPLLDQASERDGSDGPVLNARADALWLLGRLEEAQAGYARSFTLRPESETTLQGAGNLAVAMNRLEAARSYFERAIQIDPWRWQLHHELAVISSRRNDWNRAIRECQESLRLEPLGEQSRRLLVQCYLQVEQRERANAELETLLLATPEGRRAELRQWYAQVSKRP